MESNEIVINIWFIVDIGTNLCYSWRIKAYNMQGTDDDKLNILNYLSHTDYTTVPDRKLPDTAVTIYPNQEIKASLPISSINHFFENNIDYFISTLENELPVIKNIINNAVQPILQKIVNNPLYTSTIIVENEKGEAKTLLTQENKEWYEMEYHRMKNL